MNTPPLCIDGCKYYEARDIMENDICLHPVKSIYKWSDGVRTLGHVVHYRCLSMRESSCNNGELFELKGE